MLIPFKKEHLEVMDMRSHERDVLALDVDMGAILEQSTVARTGVIDGRVIACGGLSKNVYGVGDVWLVPSIYVSDYSLTFLRFVKDWLKDASQAYGITRLQTASPNDELHNKYMLFLGFEKEGEMRQYALGKDYAMWGLLWE